MTADAAVRPAVAATRAVTEERVRAVAAAIAREVMTNAAAKSSRLRKAFGCPRNVPPESRAISNAERTHAGAPRSGNAETTAANAAGTIA
ncbi:hypothetical protein QE392_003254 [Microbacterium proteolyticum]|nr:hypothetical protein [Microbacterium proteolyticum]MDQ1171450.1 hypothetical protein [Microbacterium proteolyticum]